MAVTLGDGADAAAAIEMAVRAAKARGVELHLIEPHGGVRKGRVAALVKTIEGAGVATSTVGAPMGAALTVTGAGADATGDLGTIASGLGGSALVCRAKEALAPKAVRERLGKLAAEGASEE